MRTWVRAWATASITLASLAQPARASEVASAPAPAPAPAPAADAPPTEASRWDWALLPLVFYAPETSLGVAFGIGVYDDTPSPPDRPRRDDAVSLVLQATLRKQLSVNLSGVKFWQDGRQQATEDIAVVHF